MTVLPPLKDIGTGDLEWRFDEKIAIKEILFINEDIWKWRGIHGHSGYEYVSNKKIKEGQKGYRGAQHFTDPLMRQLFNFPNITYDIIQVAKEASDISEVYGRLKTVKFLRNTSEFHSQFVEEEGVHAALVRLAMFTLTTQSSLPMVIAVTSAQSILLLADGHISDAIDVWEEFGDLYDTAFPPQRIEQEFSFKPPELIDNSRTIMNTLALQEFDEEF